MEPSFSTLDDYYKLLEVAAANPPPVQAHTCEYCAVITVENPESKDDCADQQRQYVVCALKNISRSLIRKGQDNACPFLGYFDKNDSLTQSLRVFQRSYDRRSVSICCGVEESFLIDPNNTERMQDARPLLREYGYLFRDNDCDGLNSNWRPLRYHWNASAITTESFNFVRNAMDQCTRYHALCKRTTGSFVPRRLVEIPEVANSVSTRVVDTQELGTVQWCALSYCWGGPQNETAVQADFNNPRRQKRVMLKSLPRTILDSMIVARGLGIPYIWVDSLCILQDDPEDLAEELSKISKIYGDALLTISASKASASGEGFLAPRAIGSSRSPPVRLQFEALDGSQSLLFQIGGYGLKETIDQRAWTLQESFLSTREVRFNSHYISWSCLTEHKTYDRDDQAELSLLRYRRTGPGTPTPFDRIDLLSEFWNRKLTFHGDRLLAFSAVEAVLQHHPEDRYLAGMWSSELPEAIFWIVLKSSGNRRPLEYRAPSWSWASIDTTQDYASYILKESNYNDDSRLYRQLTILDAFSEPSDLRLPFGNARRAHLSFRAPNLRLTLRRARHSRHDGDEYLVYTGHDRSFIYRYNTTMLFRDKLWLDAPEDDFESWQEDRGWEVYVPLAFCRSSNWYYCLLLKQLCLKEGKYQRVGMLQILSWGTEPFSDVCPDLEDQLFTVV